MLQDPMSMTMEDLRAAPVPRHLLDRVIDERAHCLGKGSNNGLCGAVRRREAPRACAPRRRSDTQQHQNALWEFRQTLAASRWGWRLRCTRRGARHALGEHWTSGLYLIMDEYACNLEEAMCQPGPMREKLLADDGRAARRDEGRRATAVQTRQGAGRSTSNPATWSCATVPTAPSTCASWTLDATFANGTYATTRPVRRHTRVARKDSAARRSGRRKRGRAHSLCVLFAAATTTHNLYEDRERYRMDRAHRTAINLFALMAAELLESMQAQRGVAALGVARRPGARRDAALPRAAQRRHAPHLCRRARRRPWNQRRAPPQHRSFKEGRLDRTVEEVGEDGGARGRVVAAVDAPFEPCDALFEGVARPD